MYRKLPCKQGVEEQQQQQQNPEKVIFLFNMNALYWHWTWPKYFHFFFFVIFLLFFYHSILLQYFCFVSFNFLLQQQLLVNILPFEVVLFSFLSSQIFWNFFYSFCFVFFFFLCSKGNRLLNSDSDCKFCCNNVSKEKNKFMN